MKPNTPDALPPMRQVQEVLIIMLFFIVCFGLFFKIVFF